VALFGLTLAAQTPRTLTFTQLKSPWYTCRAWRTSRFENDLQQSGQRGRSIQFRTGWTIIGPTWEGEGISGFFAIAFTLNPTPRHRVLAAILYGGSGDNQVNLSIYSDSDDVPVRFSPAGNCGESGAKRHLLRLGRRQLPPLAVTAGTQYWLVANTPTTGPAATSMARGPRVPSSFSRRSSQVLAGRFSTATWKLPER